MIVEVDKELEDVFPRYLRSREEDLGKIESALDKKDFDTLRQIGHKLSGNAVGYGLIELGEMAKQLELAAGDRKYDVCRDMGKSMRRYLSELTLKFV